MTEEKPWWAKAHKSEFRRVILGMSQEQLELLASEMKGSISAIQAQLEANAIDRSQGGRGHPDPSWEQSARMALGLLSEKKSSLSAELNRRGTTARAERQHERQRRLSDARRLVASGDLAGALLAVVDLLEGKRE